MIFWHLGVTAALMFVTLGVRRLDYRVVLLGAVLPDLIDKPLGRIFFAEQFQTGRLFAHTLLFVTVLLLGIQLFLRGETARRWFVLPIAALIHLALDGMWNHPVTLFWPFFGTGFPPDPGAGYWLDVLLLPFTDLRMGAMEAAGLACLLFLGRAYGLQNRARLMDFVRTGRLIQRNNLPGRGVECEGSRPGGRGSGERGANADRSRRAEEGPGSTGQDAG